MDTTRARVWVWFGLGDKFYPPNPNPHTHQQTNEQTQTGPKILSGRQSLVALVQDG